jgi:HTH-type transcriptional regulator/antitoxin HigA
MATVSKFIKAYEDQNFATPRGDPVDVLHFAIASMGKSQVELAAVSKVAA